MSASDRWYYTYEIGLPFNTTSLRSPHPRATFDIAWAEGATMAKDFAKRGISVSLRVVDIRRKTYDHTLALEEESP